MNKTQHICNLIQEVHDLKIADLMSKKSCIDRELKWMEIICLIIDDYEEKLAQIKVQNQTVIDNTVGVPERMPR